MDNAEIGGNLLTILVLTVCILPETASQLSTVTACHGTQHLECDYFEMVCDAPGTRIHITQMLYGFKDYSCNSKSNRCMLASRNGCCAYNENKDCFDVYTPLHAYNLHRDCSMQQECGPLQAPNHKLPSCQNELSTYVYLSYECVPFNKTNTINFCDDRVIYPYEGISNIIFDGSNNIYTGHTCTCSINSLLKEITTTYADIRMFQHKTGSGSTCSSARLTSSKPEVISGECDSRAEEEDNFIYQSVTVNGEQLTISLTDLNKSGPDDVPSLIWILVENAVRIECFTSPTPTTGATIPQTTPLPTDNTANTPVTNKESLDDDEGGNTAAIVGAVVGVLVAIIIVAVVVIFFVLKRRRGPKGPKRQISRSNTYSEQHPDNIYDEIGAHAPDNIYDPVYEPTKQQPIYDPVYEPGTTKSESEQTGRAGVDKVTPAKGSDKRIAGITKRLKTPFTKMFTYIKSRRGDDPQRKTSYDHLHVTGVTIDNSSDEEPRHAYSHTNGDKKVVKDGPMVLIPEISQTKTNSSETQKVKNVPSDAEITAVGVGDFYIEFKTDTDDNDPKLAKNEVNDTSNGGLKPISPVDSPPSLNPSRAPSPLPKPSRSASPMMEINSELNPDHINLHKTDKTPYYDYADTSKHRSEESKFPQAMNAPKVTAVDEQPDYDYALDVEDETNRNSIYEDVEKQMREASMRKHKSEADLLNRISGYEVPVTQRQLSDPKSPLSIGSVEQGLNKITNRTTPLKPLNNIKSKQQNLNLKAELQSRLQKNKPAIVTSVSNDVVKTLPDSAMKVVKSDNLKTKDYETAPEKKSVLQMKKAFENK